jgi:hypothetical protein
MRLGTKHICGDQGRVVNNWRIWACTAAVALIVVTGSLHPVPSSAQSSTDVASSPHLGYGINVRNEDKIGSLFSPLGFEWLKLWEEYGPLPTTRYPYQVLFLIDCYSRSGDLDGWQNDVRALAIAGKGLVEAYEICNEPNFARWVHKDVDPYQAPDPALYVEMLQIAYETIKEVDPGAIVVSAGLAPVGRIQGTCNGWAGNNCQAMDEREYARQMFLLGAGDYFDVFGYHPYGFAYSPETDPDSVGNGFAFRGAEIMYDMMTEHGLGDKQVWATEFSWLRDPSYDPDPAGWCHRVPEYENSFGWMDMSEARQSDYFVRAFQYADANWPWMGVMVVWNLDWYNYNWMCEASRFFSVRKDDGTALGTPALAYGALAAMEKQPGHFGPRLVVTPTLVSFHTEDVAPQVLTAEVTPLNAGFQVLTWTATLKPGGSLTPTWPVTSALQGVPLTVTVDSSTYAAGASYTATLAISSTAPGVLDVPQMVTVTLDVEQTAPRLSVQPDVTFLADVDEPGVITATVTPLNLGGGVLTWTATAVPGKEVVPVLPVSTGQQGDPMPIVVDTTGYALGTFDGLITVSASPPETLDSPQTVSVTLMVVPEIHRIHLPLVLRATP